MKVYLFGNEDLPEDNYTFRAIEYLKNMVDNKKSIYNNINFIFIKPNQDLPLFEDDEAIIMDTIEGIEKVTVLSEKEIDKFTLSSRSTVHDYDLGFQLKYLKKLGKIKRLIIIGIPKNNTIDYLTIHSIFKKLVAQDIQGS